MMPAAFPAAEDIPLAAKLAFLRQPGSYPQPAIRVETVETHMSWVFLAGDFAYKLKKPVCYGEFRADRLERRRFYCDEELRLNRRLAPQVYLDVLPMTVEGTGLLCLGGNGPVADWLVKMRRLPRELMLDHSLQAGTASAADVDRIARMLALFHTAAPPVPLAPEALHARFEADIAENRATLLAPAYGLPAALIDKLCDWQLAALQTCAARLDQRLRSGCVIEGHGDLRAEHVYIGEPPAVIDCIEFSRALRIADGADEIAFLALECERLGAADLGSLLLARYGELSGRLPDPCLVRFYQSMRAVTRARLTIRHLDEEAFRHSPEWRRRALHYLALAQARCA
jgi:aminoglycoside phosphotransferase family enzyme